MTRFMILTSCTLAAINLGLCSATAEEDPVMTFQLRSYTTAPEKLEVLVERFQRVNLPLFERHDITLIGAWTPHESDDGDERLVYLVGFPSMRAAELCWKNFATDPDWINAFEREKRIHGTVVSGVETVYLGPTDYSPALPGIGGRSAQSDTSNDQAKTSTDSVEEERLFELRRYLASPGKLNELNKRFREHTMELFSKHGMTNILYTMPIESDQGADTTLIYFLAHPSYPRALNAWESFRSDPIWNQVREASQPDGVPLAASVERWMLVPTEFSPLK
ncbi:NIPSNAP family protein [Tautonia rosea]|uniref:NIPSNAP family protein n=1 Tax=Tautonia rosea TaxID=2728037 RepID=UPI00147276F0|nr:NIPSNAP family protein [Tautonia rosea]